MPWLEALLRGQPVLARANAAILLQGSPMVTAICGYIDPVTLAIRYATAGHPPLILARPNVPAVLLPHDGLPLGIEPEAGYRTFDATAAAGAILVLYTDGVTEFEHDVVGGEARLLEAARGAVAADDPALAIKRAVFGAQSPTDDVAILTIRFAAASSSLEHGTERALGAFTKREPPPSARGAADASV